MADQMTTEEWAEAATEAKAENLVRAGRGGSVIYNYQERILPPADRDEPRTHAIDLIADVLHWLGQNGLDPESAVSIAKMHYADEVAELEAARAKGGAA